MLEMPRCDSQQSAARVQGAFQVYDQVNLRAPPKMAPPESCPPASSHPPPAACRVGTQACLPLCGELQQPLLQAKSAFVHLRVGGAPL